MVRIRLGSLRVEAEHAEQPLTRVDPPQMTEDDD